MQPTYLRMHDGVLLHTELSVETRLYSLQQPLLRLLLLRLLLLCMLCLLLLCMLCLLLLSMLVRLLLGVLYLLLLHGLCMLHLLCLLLLGLLLLLYGLCMLHLLRLLLLSLLLLLLLCMLLLHDLVVLQRVLHLHQHRMDCNRAGTSSSMLCYIHTSCEHKIFTTFDVCTVSDIRVPSRQALQTSSCVTRNNGTHLVFAFKQQQKQPDAQLVA